MIPSVYALVILTAGVVLIHFGLKDLESVLGTISLTPTPFVSTGEAVPQLPGSKGQ